MTATFERIVDDLHPYDQGAVRMDVLPDGCTDRDRWPLPVDRRAPAKVPI